jgi:hypoxanthine phosphoribosyltransferase
MGKQERNNLLISRQLTMTSENLGSRILLVDDLVDSGVTLQKTVPWLYSYGQSPIAEVRTAVIWYKACSVVVPDYYTDYLPDNPWIHQPFEHYEYISPSELEKKMSQR